MGTEAKTASNWLYFDEPSYSRDKVTVRAGAGSVRTLTSGMVVASRAKGAAAAVADAGNTGDGAMGAITVGAAAVAGAYELEIVEAAANAGRFVVRDPQGDVIGEGNVAVAFAAGGIGFTLADGAADFVVGDKFAITVAAGDGKVIQIDFSATNGDEDAYGVLLNDVEAADAVDAKGVLVLRHARIRKGGLVWPGSATAGQQAAAIVQLEALGIVVQNG